MKISSGLLAVPLRGPAPQAPAVFSQMTSVQPSVSNPLMNCIIYVYIYIYILHIFALLTLCEPPEGAARFLARSLPVAFSLSAAFIYIYIYI